MKESLLALLFVTACFLAGVTIGTNLGVSYYSTVEIQDKIIECEMDLPRNKRCYLVATPEKISNEK